MPEKFEAGAARWKSSTCTSVCRAPSKRPSVPAPPTPSWRPPDDSPFVPPLRHPARHRANRPGGAQALFLAGVGKEDESRNQTLTLRAFRDYQAGHRPSGPGARDRLAFFASVERRLEELDVTAPTAKRSDQELLNLRARRVGALHLGLANHCRFLDPGKALRLTLARSAERDRPPAGMCDSARCPQVTHHSCHREV